MVHTLGGNLCSIGLWTGDWEEARQLGADVLEDTSDPFDRGLSLNSFIPLKLFRGESVESEMAELDAIAAMHDEQQRRNLLERHPGVGRVRRRPPVRRRRDLAAGCDQPGHGVTGADGRPRGHLAR